MTLRAIRRRLFSGLEWLAPSLYADLRSLYIRHRFMRRFLVFQDHVVFRLYDSVESIRVLAGPFQGMRYFNEATWGPLIPKWAGTYEMELHSWISHIIERPPRIVIDVGCAEGFYAVGLARLLPGVRVFAFDIDRFSRRQLKKLADLNGVADQIQVDGWCSHEELERLTAGGNALLIADIEGHELSLLDPVACPSLLTSQILVELHPAAGGTLAETRQELLARFSASHRVAERPALSREVGDGNHLLPFGFQSAEIPPLLDECRGVAQSWLHLSPLPPAEHD